MKIRILPTVLLSVFIMQMLPLGLFLNTASAAGEITEIIEYEMKGDADDFEYGGLFFSDKPSLPTTPIVVPAKSGKIIKKLEWVTKKGDPLRVISIPTGKTEFKASDNFTDTLNGTKYKIRSKDNTNYGGVYYWDRWTAGDSGNFNGKYWRAGGGRVTVKTSEPSQYCPGGVPPENKNPTTGASFGANLPQYPGCTDPNLQADIPRTTGFFIVGKDDDDPLAGIWVKDGGVSLTDITASRTEIDYTSPIDDVHGSQGYTDPSTIAGQVVDVPSVNKITISFQQTFDNDTNRKYWANPGAKQVWYFSKFIADFDSYTYIYKDKKLKVTYADGVSGLVISGNTCVAPGGTTQLTATLTKVDGSSWPLKKHDKLTWTSSKMDVMTVSDSGLVTAVASTGSSTIKAQFVDPAQALNETDTFEMTVGTGTECKDTDDNPTQPEIPEGNGSGQCTWVIGSPSQGTVARQSDMDPGANGVIRADNRDSEKFDVLQGIPTSESLFTNALADSYLYKQEWAQMSGKTTYNCKVDVTYARQWTVPGPPICSEAGCVPGPPVIRTDTQPKTYTFQIFRDFSYWQINNLEVYKINRAEMSNYALPGGKVTMTPSGYTPPSLDSTHEVPVGSHVYPVNTTTITFTPPLLTGGLNSPPPLPNDEPTLKGMAETNTAQSQVKNDMVTFNGSTIMNPALTTKDGPTPSNIPNPTTIGRDVLYKPNNMISSTLLNKANTSGSGTIFYELLPKNVNGGADTQFPINGINTVTVHTPTVDYSDASNDAAHNQRTTPDYSRRAFILDRPFTVTIPTSGQHRNIPGYGNRDYAKYIKLKQVLFQFDVYSDDMSTFYPANTWIDVPVSQIVTTFYLPKWINEGDYTVYYRNFAENAPSSGFTTQQDANLDLANHVATNTVPVQVIGRVFDFKITDIADPNWETVFRTAKGSSTPKGTSYWVGLNGIDGNANGTQFPYVLPILRGSHPLANYKSVSVKTGYHFKFDLKTKGNMFGDKDAIRITPTFYFQDNDPSTPANRIPVDLYYHSDSKKFIKVGSAADVERREIILNNRLRNVPYTDIVNTGGSIYDINSGWSMTRDQYVNAFVKRATEPTYVGGYDVQILPSPLRTFINTFDRPSNANATPARVNASEQQWYGEYSLPASVYVVSKGTDLAAYGRKNRLDDKSPIFLKNGYITVNFNIETIRNADLARPYLQYIHGPLNNQWWNMEGYDSTDGKRDHLNTDPYGVQFKIEDGDVILYDANRSSYDDYSPNGTH